MLTEGKIKLIFTLNFIEFLNIPEVFYEYGVFKQVHCCKRFITPDDNWATRWASENGHLEVVKYLVSKGSDVTARNNYAVRWASHNGHLELVSTWFQRAQM